MWQFYSNFGPYWFESYTVVCQGWPKTSLLQLVGNMTGISVYRIPVSRGASGNSLFPIQKNLFIRE